MTILQIFLCFDDRMESLSNKNRKTEKKKREVLQDSSQQNIWMCYTIKLVLCFAND